MDEQKAEVTILQNAITTRRIIRLPCWRRRNPGGLKNPPVDLMDCTDPDLTP
jgi:hypothetical protein